MSVKCPNCGNEMNLKGARPGRFTPACPLCKQRFALVVPDDPNGVAHASKIKPGALTDDIVAALGIEAPVAKSAPGKPQATGPREPAGGRSAAGMTVGAAPIAPAPPRVPSAISATAPPAPSQIGLATGPAQAAPRDAGVRAGKASPGASAVGMSVTAPPAQSAVAAPRSSGASGAGMLATAAPAPSSIHPFHDDEDLLDPPASGPGHKHEDLRHSRGDSNAAHADPRGAHADAHRAGHGTEHASAPLPRHEHHTFPDVQASAPADPDLVGSLGGYELIRKLGAGGMGAVYLARQVSLDRAVAVKVLQSDLAGDAQFVARFTREAFAAAQLNHHNVVQIHELGEQRATHFFSMEFVEGQTLADLVKSTGPIDPEVAAGYILQAARGLKFAHDHGMVHRDIKPENLMLNDAGLVKVADLGLVKTGAESRSPTGGKSLEAASGSANITQAKWAMGTPAYMAPEQTQDAASVDGRADIYSLGCTFYDLLTGRPPFSGKTALEVMTKHVSEAPISPERISKQVPVTVSVIVMKMMAKRPEQRFQSMGEVVKALEDYLHVDSTKPFSPKQEHVRVLEFAVERFNASKWAKFRPMIITGFFAICVLGTLGCAIMIADPIDKLRWAGAFVGLGVLTPLAYIIQTGITKGTFVFRKLRQLVFGASFFDWITWLVTIALIGTGLYMFDQHWGWIGVGVLAVMFANAFHFSVDLLMGKDRSAPIVQTETMLKEMRLKGLEETSLRQFVCKYAGERWEEFYESLFGYEAKILARETWGKSERGKNRRKYAAWRDALIAWIDHRMQSRKDAKARKLLRKLEEKSLTIGGIDEKAARKKAARTADTMVAKAEKVRKSATRTMMTVGPTLAKSAVKIEVIKKNWIDDDHEESETTKDARKRESYFQRRYGGFSGLLFGQQPRFLLAALVLVGFFSWQYQNREQYKDVARSFSGTNVDPETIAMSDNITTAKQLVDDVKLKGEDKKLETSRLSDNAARVKTGPKEMREGVQSAAGFYDRQRENIGKTFGRWGAGLAGLVLLIGAFFRGKILGVMVILSAGIILAAPFLPPSYFGIGINLLTMVGGTALAALSIFWLRDVKAPG